MSPTCQEDHCKVVDQCEVEKSAMTDPIEKENHLSLWDEIKIIDREEH